MLLALPIAGCLDTGPSLSETRSASTVADQVNSGCSTAVVLGLSRQIADEEACEHPGGFAPFTPNANLVLTSTAVLPYLEADAAADLQDEAVGHSIRVNSALRTLAQQYLLFTWWDQSRCGISAAATVGHSNHESGRAVDLANYSSVLQSMPARGWAHDVAGDPVHFDHTASEDVRNRDVTAFQTLWNRNNPNDKIAIDGAYGPQTQARLRKSPSTGFALGATCSTAQAHAQIAAVDGPDIVLSGAHAHYSVTLQNNSQTDWPEGSALAIDGASSVLHDSSWDSATEVTLLPFVPAGGIGTVEFDVTAPTVTDDTPIAQTLNVTDGVNVLGTVQLALTVTTHMDQQSDPPSSDGGDTQDTGELSGGCSTGKGGGLGVLLVLGALLVRRRR